MVFFFHTGGSALQGQDMDELFRRDRGILRPVLHRLDIPVRAIVMPVVDTSVARRLHQAVVRRLSPLFPEGMLWLQNPDLLHSTMYHASTHLVSAEIEEILGRSVL